jgi:amino acid efflux transporter
MTTTREHPTDALRRGAPGLGVVAGTALTVAGVVGTGVLVLPALAVRQAGPAALVAVGALLVLSVPLAATFAALGARFPSGGGVAGFVARAMGSRAATVTAWWFYFGVPLGIPALDE